MTCHPGDAASLVWARPEAAGFDVVVIEQHAVELAVRIDGSEAPLHKRGEHKPPTCEHGEWRFAGADPRRGLAKWRCPTEECSPYSRWVKADRLHPLVPRESKRWKALYRGRASVEREFGRLKNEWALLPLRVRGVERVRLHADLTILAKLGCALTRGRAAATLAA